jgi:hypothetical protein
VEEFHIKKNAILRQAAIISAAPALTVSVNVANAVATALAVLSALTRLMAVFHVQRHTFRWMHEPVAERERIPQFSNEKRTRVCQVAIASIFISSN